MSPVLVRVALYVLLAPALALAAADVVFEEDFSDVGDGGLPPGWVLGPPAHAPFFSAFPDHSVFGIAPPSVRVETPLLTQHYRLATPHIPLPHMRADYTLKFTLRVAQPDSPFQVDVIYLTETGEWDGRTQLLSLVGENMSGSRRYCVSFNPRKSPTATGGCWIGFGMPYAKVLHEGAFWIDDVVIREGKHGEFLAFYPNPVSVAPGGDVRIHASSGRGSARLEVYRETDHQELVAEWELTGLQEEPIPNDAWRFGCDWPVAQTFEVGADWPSGLYTLKLDDGDQSVWETLVVSGVGTEGKLLVVIPTHTDQAYNAWGGESFYTQPPIWELSFERPTWHRYKGVYQTPIHLIRWLHRSGIPYAVASDDELHSRPDLLAHYSGLALTWHSEYWSREMRDGVDQFISRGGSILCFSGNTSWWQTRIAEPDDPIEPGPVRRLVCYKSDAREEDPYRDVDPTRLTVNWDEEPLNRSPALSFGLNWREGGMVNWSSRSDCPCEYDWLDGHGGYTAVRTDHWIYDGTSAFDGATIGQELAIVGYEVDGAPLQWIQGRPEIAPGGETSARYQVLGYAPCQNLYERPGYALMVIREFQAGNFVFNGGTTGWCWGLAGDPVIQGITRNLIDRLPERPVRPTPIPPVALDVDLIPNPATRGVRVDLVGPGVPDAIDIFTAGGRHLTSSAVHRVGTRVGVARWDLKDTRGRRVPAGVYWIRGASEARTIVVPSR